MRQPCPNVSPTLFLTTHWKQAMSADFDTFFTIMVFFSFRNLNFLGSETVSAVPVTFSQKRNQGLLTYTRSNCIIDHPCSVCVLLMLQILQFFFFCGQSAVLRPSVQTLPGIGWCGAGLPPFPTACWWLTPPSAITGVSVVARWNSPGGCGGPSVPLLLQSCSDNHQSFFMSLWRLSRVFTWVTCMAQYAKPHTVCIWNWSPLLASGLVRITQPTWPLNGLKKLCK